MAGLKFTPTPNFESSIQLSRQGEALRSAKKLKESAYAAPDRPFFLLQINIALRERVTIKFLMPVCFYSGPNLNFSRWSAPAGNFQKFFWHSAAPPPAGLFQLWIKFSAEWTGYVPFTYNQFSISAPFKRYPNFDKISMSSITDLGKGPESWPEKVTSAKMGAYCDWKKTPDIRHKENTRYTDRDYFLNAPQRE